MEVIDFVLILLIIFLSAMLYEDYSKQGASRKSPGLSPSSVRSPASAPSPVYDIDVSLKSLPTVNIPLITFNSKQNSVKIPPLNNPTNSPSSSYSPSPVVSPSFSPY
jgi:hypothetical protein